MNSNRLTLFLLRAESIKLPLPRALRVSRSEWCYAYINCWSN
ncbi:hypothetical protein Hanom_Chr17g01588621 [Helianthus anomalus]